MQTVVKFSKVAKLYGKWQLVTVAHFTTLGGKVLPLPICAGGPHTEVERQYNSSGLIDASQWLPFINEFHCDVKILVCEYCSDHSEPSSPNRPRTHFDRVDVVKWCIKHGFELVELNSIIEDDKECDLEDDFPETVGMKRIIQALEAHVWPNMNRFPKDGGLGATRLSTASASNSNSLDDSSQLDDSSDKEGDEDDGLFEALFEQLSIIKSKSTDLPLNDRKEYAEKVAVAFWRAIGGDEKEIEDLGMASDDAK